MATAHPTPVPQQPQPLTRSTTTRSASRRRGVPHGRRSRSPKPSGHGFATPTGRKHALAHSYRFQHQRVPSRVPAHAASATRGSGERGAPPTASTHQRVPQQQPTCSTTTRSASRRQRVPAHGARVRVPARGHAQVHPQRVHQPLRDMDFLGQLFIESKRQSELARLGSRRSGVSGKLATS